MATVLLHVDHTLINSHSLFFLLGTFHPMETLKLVSSIVCPAHWNPLTERETQEWNHFLEKMGHAYDHFVKRVAIKEQSSDPLCLFRPETMDWLKAMYQRKKEGKIKHILLYTRSSYLRFCQFTRDVIHACLGLSEEENPFITEILHESQVSLYDGKEGVYWIHHEKMMEKQNSILVSYYDFVTSFDRLWELYVSSLKKMNLSEQDVEQVARGLYDTKGSVIEKPCYNRKMELHTLYFFLKERTGLTMSSLSLPRMDEGWKMGQHFLEQLDREEEWRKRCPIEKRSDRK